MLPLQPTTQVKDTLTVGSIYATPDIPPKCVYGTPAFFGARLRHPWPLWLGLGNVAMTP